jgi:indole-3-glycerol phosphate synthase
MILDDIVAKKRLDLAEEEKQISTASLLKKAENKTKTRDFYSALATKELSIIAEVKKASPSKGIIANDFYPTEIAKRYENEGASAISVLTEKHFFMGDNVYLTQISKNVGLPILRKDFIISERQIIEAKAIGADAILLIAAILDENTMKRFYSLASELHLDCLFEAHNKDELNKVIHCGARIIGINNRNLNTFEVRLSTFEELSPFIPKNCLSVAESGIFTKHDAKRMVESGANAILVGEALMKNGKLEDLKV